MKRKRFTKFQSLSGILHCSASAAQSPFSEPIRVSIPFRDFTLFCRYTIRERMIAGRLVSIPFRDFTLFCGDIEGHSCPGGNRFNPFQGFYIVLPDRLGITLEKDNESFNPFQGFYIVLLGMRSRKRYIPTTEVSIPFRDFTLFCMNKRRIRYCLCISVSIPFRDFTLFCKKKTSL